MLPLYSAKHFLLVNFNFPIAQFPDWEYDWFVDSKRVPKTTQNDSSIPTDSTKPKRYQVTMLPEDHAFIEGARKQAGIAQWKIYSILAGCVRDNPRVVLDLSK